MKALATIGMALMMGAGHGLVEAEGAGRQREAPWVYQVNIMNITKGTDLSQGLVCTPILLATHAPDVHLFALGRAPGRELAMLAEGGATAPLAEALDAVERVYQVVTTDAPLLPGQSVQVEIPYTTRGAVLSLASMLLPTNDGFIGLDGVALPWYRNRAETYLSPAYDAGSELNDELCASIPGPHCEGEGYSPEKGEGLIHVHSGIHGVGDLMPENYDWRNPVVKITVELVQKAN